jgi:hypothetical protein
VDIGGRLLENLRPTSLIPQITPACDPALLPNWWRCCRQASRLDAIIEVEGTIELEQRQIIGELLWASVLRVKDGLCDSALLSLPRV